MAQWRKQVFSGSHDPNQLDPEPLARIAAPVMFFFGSANEAAQQACDAARTTCQAPLVLDACRLLGSLLHASLAGAAREDVLAAGERPADDYRDRIGEIAARSYLAKQPPAIRAGDTVVEALEAALWAFGQARSFRDGALRAVNLGGASDVVGAVYGQLAGAHFGLAAIPADWRKGLIKKDVIEDA